MTQPPALPYQTVPTENSDDGYLLALSICHYVLGGITILFSCIFIVHIAMGIAMLNGGFGPVPANGNPGPPRIVGYVMTGFGTAALLIGWSLGVMTIISGRCIAKRQRFMLSMIVAGANCISFPLGTTLGVFTFILLLRPSVKMTYS